MRQYGRAMDNGPALYICALLCRRTLINMWQSLMALFLFVFSLPLVSGMRAEPSMNRTRADPRWIEPTPSPHNVVEGGTRTDFLDSSPLMISKVCFEHRIGMTFKSDLSLWIHTV